MNQMMPQQPKERLLSSPGMEKYCFLIQLFRRRHLIVVQVLKKSLCQWWNYYYPRQFLFSGRIKEQRKKLLVDFAFSSVSNILQSDHENHFSSPNFCYIFQYLSTNLFLFLFEYVNLISWLVYYLCIHRYRFCGWYEDWLYLQGS